MLLYCVPRPPTAPAYLQRCVTMAMMMAGAYACALVCARNRDRGHHLDLQGDMV